MTLSGTSTITASLENSTGRVSLVEPQTSFTTIGGYQTLTDSGYGSSQQGHYRPAAPKARQCIVAFPQRSFPVRQSTRVQLPVFNRDVNQRFYQRFRTIQGPIEQLLGKYLVSRKKVTPQQWREADIASRLLVLGNCEAEAKENVVVFCPPLMCKPARRFYDKDQTVKGLLEPTDGMSPNFSIVVADGFATIARTDVDVLCPGTEPPEQTLCGQPILFSNESMPVAQATLGGTIIVVSSDGTSELYGLTAGHSLGKWAISDHQSDDADELMFEDDADYSGFSSDDSDDDSEAKYSQEDGNLGVLAKAEVDISVPVNGKPIAKVSQVSTNGPSGYFDWALIKMTNYLPNLVASETLEGSVIRRPVGVGIIGSPPIPGVIDLESMQRDVTLIAHTQMSRHGRLSRGMGRVKIGPGGAFIDAYLVTLEDGPVCHGTSGAWVIDSNTLKILGHVVATDPTGDVYVLPMKHIFDDIRQELGARKVSVASHADILEYGERSQIPTGSSNRALSVLDSGRDDVSTDDEGNTEKPMAALPLSGPSRQTSHDCSQTSSELEDNNTRSLSRRDPSPADPSACNLLTCPYCDMEFTRHHSQRPGGCEGHLASLGNLASIEDTDDDKIDERDSSLVSWLRGDDIFPQSESSDEPSSRGKSRLQNDAAQSVALPGNVGDSSPRRRPRKELDSWVEFPVIKRWKTEATSAQSGLRDARAQGQSASSLDRNTLFSAESFPSSDNSISSGRKMINASEHGPSLTKSALSVQTGSPDNNTEEETQDDGEMGSGFNCVDEIMPTFTGFQSQVLMLNPGMQGTSDFLVHRLAHQQVVRYKTLLGLKVKHLGRGADCPSGLLCQALCEKADNIQQTKDVSVSEPDTDGDTPMSGLVSKDRFPPDIPITPTQHLPAEFECPLCFSCIRVSRPSDWVKHVHEDVQPLVCTWVRCRHPESFERKEDWVRHENEAHRHLEWWACDIEECRYTCYRQDNFLQHLIREHSFSNPKLTANRGRPKPEDHETSSTWTKVEECHVLTSALPESEPCKFCGKTFPTWKQLTDHLAKHMEQIALRVLRLVAAKGVELETDTVISPIREFSPLQTFDNLKSGGGTDTVPRLTYDESMTDLIHGGLCFFNDDHNAFTTSEEHRSPPISGLAGFDPSTSELRMTRDLSAQGFIAGLRKDGMTHDLFDVFDPGQSHHVSSTPSDFDEFNNTQDLGIIGRTSLEYGQSSLGTGSHDSFDPHRRSLGSASSSYLTVPNRVGTGSDTASNVFSDRDSNVFPFGRPPDANPFTACPSQQGNALMSHRVNSRQRSASSAAISTQRPNLLATHGHDATSYYQPFGSVLRTAINNDAGGSIVPGFDNAFQSSHANAISPSQHGILRNSFSGLTSLEVGIPSALETSYASSSTRGPRSTSATSRSNTSTRDARATLQPRRSSTSRLRSSYRSDSSPHPDVRLAPKGENGDSHIMVSRTSSVTERKPKGRRTGPVHAANIRRKKRDTCQYCLFRKIKCNMQPDGVCQKCASQGVHCETYHFNQYRHRPGESLDLVARLYFNHVCNGNRSRRWVSMELLDGANCLDYLQQLVERAAGLGTMKFWFGRRLLYSVDLRCCSDAVNDSAAASKPLESFGESINRALSSASNSWLRFNNVNMPSGGDLHHIERMLNCTDMLPWHTFTILDPFQFGLERVLDANSQDDLPLLQTAALLSRLISVQLEQAGYEQLHSRLNSTNERPSQEAIDLLKKLLLSLRRRLCMWHSIHGLDGRAEWSERVRKLTQILYFHLFSAFDRPSSSLASQQPDLMDQTVWQDLFGSQQMAWPMEDLPKENSLEGFQHWMEQGFQYLDSAAAQLGVFPGQAQSYANTTWQGRPSGLT